MGLQRGFPSVGPANVKGIELNAYAAELARVSVWIGEIQWMRRNGFPGSRQPVLDPLETIECRDAILTPEGGEPAVARSATLSSATRRSLGGKTAHREYLGEEYVSSHVRRVRGPSAPAKPDLVCYWFVKAGDHLEGSGFDSGLVLVATNSIRGGANRRALERRDRRQANFRRLERRAVGDRWGGRARLVGVLRAGGRGTGARRS